MTFYQLSLKFFSSEIHSKIHSLKPFIRQFHANSYFITLLCVATLFRGLGLDYSLDTPLALVKRPPVLDRINMEILLERQKSQCSTI